MGIFSRFGNKQPSARQLYDEGLILYQTNRLKEAIKMFSRALQIDPDFLPARRQRGLAYGKLGLLEKAIEDFEAVLAYFPEKMEAGIEYTLVSDPNHDIEADVSYNLGVFYGKLERYEQAKKFYDRAIKLKPDFANAYCNRGDMSLKTGQWEEAVLYFTKALELNPYDILALFGRALANERLGKKREALDDAKRFLELAPPEHPLVREVKAFLDFELESSS